MLLHKCETCDHKSKCSLEKIIASCKEALASGGVQGLANHVLTEQAKFTEANDRFQYIMAGMEALGIKQLSLVRDFRELVTAGTPDERKDELRRMWMAAIMSLGDYVMTNASNFMAHLANAFGFGPEDFNTPEEPDESLVGGPDEFTSAITPSHSLH